MRLRVVIIYSSSQDVSTSQSEWLSMVNMIRLVSGSERIILVIHLSLAGEAKGITILKCAGSIVRAKYTASYQNQSESTILSIYSLLVGYCLGIQKTPVTYIRTLSGRI